jgi:hypothetical protein
MKESVEQMRDDGLDPAKWEQTHLVDWIPNRLFLFPSELWHSPFPREGWGDRPENGRLIQVYFFS